MLTATATTGKQHADKHGSPGFIHLCLIYMLEEMIGHISEDNN